MRLRLIALAASLLASASGVSSAANGTGDALQTPDPCAVPEQITPLQAYARPIDDTPTLAFIAYVESLPASKHAEVVKRAAIGLPRSAETELDAKTNDACTRTALSFRTIRLVYDLSKRWTTDQAIDLETSARYALTALNDDGVSASSRDLALAPFETDAKALEAYAVAASAQPAQCEGTTITARADRPVPLDYPLIAVQARTQGTVQLSVSTDAHGFVKRIGIFKRGVPDGDAGDAIVDAAALSAGSTTYTPLFDSCRPTEGTYVFRADFNAR